MFKNENISITQKEINWIPITSYISYFASQISSPYLYKPEEEYF